MRRITEILKQLGGPTQPVPADARTTIRHAVPADAEALAALAALDSSHPPRGRVIVAEVSGELWAAISLDDNHVVTHPSRPSGELAFHLVGRARELNGAGGSRGRARRRTRAGDRPARRLGTRTRPA